MECWLFTFTFTFGTLVTEGLSATRADRTLFAREIPRQSFPLEGECTPGLPNADKRSSSLDIFQSPLTKFATASPR